MIAPPLSPARYGMVGGGDGALIGGVHRKAARLDDHCALVCGAFASDPERSRSWGVGLGLPEERVYGTWQEMIEGETELDAGERMEFVSVVTPNHLHVPVAKAALEAGFAVLCDKPLAHSLDAALELASVVEERGALLGVTYNYSGYPMVREARARVRGGELGAVRKVVAEYSQGWLATRLERAAAGTGGHKQASWRTDPERAGAAGAMGDIGSHAAHLAEFVTGLELERVCADLGRIVEGRELDDDGAVFLRFTGGVRGVLMASQIAVGRENGLRLRVFCENGTVEWFQEEPNSLLLDEADRPRVTLRTGGPDTGADAAEAARLPAGHPEGYLEGFANLYADFAGAVRRRRKDPQAQPRWTPGIADGLRGMRLLDAVVASDAAGQEWVEMG